MFYASFLSFITSRDADIFQSDDIGLVKSTLSVLTVLAQLYCASSAGEESDLPHSTVTASVQLKAFTLN